MRKSVISFLLLMAACLWMVIAGAALNGPNPAGIRWLVFTLSLALAFVCGNVGLDMDSSGKHTKKKPHTRCNGHEAQGKMKLPRV